MPSVRLLRPSVRITAKEDVEMKKFSLPIAALLLSLPFLAHAQEVDATKEKEAVRRAVESYLAKDREMLKRVLYPGAKIFSVESSGKKITKTLISAPAKRLRPGATVFLPPQRIIAIDVTAEGASVKVESDLSSGPAPAVEPRKHIQYISLLKLGGEWKIVSILMPPLRFAEAGGN